MSRDKHDDDCFLPCQKCGEPNKLTPAEYYAAVYCEDCVKAWEKADADEAVSQSIQDAEDGEPCECDNEECPDCNPH